MSVVNSTEKCLLCSQNDKIMIAVQETMTGCEFSIEQILQKLHFLTGPEVVCKDRSLCYICVAKIQSCFKIKMSFEQINVSSSQNEEQTLALNKNIKPERQWDDGFELLNDHQMEFYNCPTNVDLNHESENSTRNETIFIEEKSVPGNSHHSNLSLCCCEKLYKVEKEIGDLKRMVTNIHQLLTNRGTAVEDCRMAQGNDFDFKFQIITLEQLNEFEQLLNDPKAAAQYKRMVRQIGGDSFRKHARRALSMTFSNIVAYQISWSGLKNSYKIKDKNYISIIKEAIMERWNEEEVNVEQVIKSWLQHAGDRLKQISKSKMSVP